jgi:adenosylcobinamide kinase / adenosylcobinamide-phosphate guanylyltransferase
VGLTVILGPRRSGKSAVAERIALATAAPVAYLAPLTVTDPELQARVAAHRARRPPEWRTVESHDALTALDEVAPGETVLLDSLGTWVSEALWRGGALEDPPRADPYPTLAALADAVDNFAARAAVRPEATLVVAEEAGWGPVPPDPSTRRWLDALGDAAQACVRRSDRALLVVAGRELELP